MLHNASSQNTSFKHNIIYPVRCAHYPPPCHCLDCFDLLVFLTPRVLFFTSKVTKLSIIFEARAVILEARGLIWTISGAAVSFSQKKALDNSPTQCPWTHFLRSHELAVFFECSGFWILEPCGLLPSTIISLAAQDGIRASVGSCFTARGVSRRRSRLRRLAVFGRTDGAALRAAFGVGPALRAGLWRSGAGFRSFGSGFEVLWLGFEVLGLGFGSGFEVLRLGFEVLAPNPRSPLKHQ
jgi:hypothetical protein